MDISTNYMLKLGLLERMVMKYIRILFLCLFVFPFGAFAAPQNNEFMVAAQLLSAARNADIQQVQILVNNGANINYVDATGLSLVCTALMNNDMRAAQILQMYGADASQCDRQIKRYNNRTKPKPTGGLFSGLSSVQNMTLAAAGAAVVVGGLLLLTDVFDPGNNNENGNLSGGTRPGGSGNTGGDDDIKATYILPYGPNLPTAADEQKANYNNELNVFSDKTGLYYKEFEAMTATKQNYLLMMHGYSPFARGYFGMDTLRNSSGVPLDASTSSLWGQKAEGGQPVNVALVTANGVNATSDSSLRDKLLLWTTVNNNTVAAASRDTVSSKYFNNSLTSPSGASSFSDFVTTEQTSVTVSKETIDLDLSGYGTAIHNVSATPDDNRLAKVLGGNLTADKIDYVGFMPNGQMTIFRTGGGTILSGKGLEDETASGTYTENDSLLSQIELFGKTLAVSITDGVITATADDDETAYTGYIGTDGYLYIDSNADGVINQAYSMVDGELTLVKQEQNVDYYNYKALVNAAKLWRANKFPGGRSRPEVIANASVIASLRDISVERIESVIAGETKDNKVSLLARFVDKYYDVDKEDSYEPAVDAISFFNGLGTNYFPLTLFSTGAFETNSQGLSETLTATFENSVPMVYENAEHYFMSVVAVGLTGTGTQGTENVSDYSPDGKIALAKWHDISDETHYKSRACGMAGKGTNDIDPWCFAAAGITDELAVSSAAGAVGVLKSAFSIDNSQIFALLALTADGPFLAANSDGKEFTEEGLLSHLQGMYELPTDYQFKVDGGADYLETFKEVFGYGLINLERATTPNTAIYLYNGKDIVSADTNSYWGAVTATTARASSVLNLAGARVSTAVYDVLESVDGSMRLPRVWKNEFALGNTTKRGLYMGDVLGEFQVRNVAPATVRVGDMKLSMATSERAYADNMGGLDNLSLAYENDNWDMTASYQRYFTDGESRFSGMANPVLGLASNVVTTGAGFKSGNWSFGGRGYSGLVTDESLLENDPTVSAQFMPGQLGRISGGEGHVAYGADKFNITAAFGMARESDTVLGAVTDGLLDLGAGNTTYVDVMSHYDFSDNFGVSARATFAHTTSDAVGMMILGLTDIESNAFAIGANIGNFEFTVAQPLAITDGAFKYAHAEYDVVEVANGQYDLVVRDTRVADLSLRSDVRETRLTGAYRHKFGEFTDGAFGFIYRINPNHTDDFGNESIFMMKLSHRLGI